MNQNEQALEALHKEYEYFAQKTKEFYEGTLTKQEYKGISGGFGSYAERGGKSGMLRIRIPGGQLTKEKYAFLSDVITRYEVEMIKFTTCETIQLHRLSPQKIYDISKEALAHGIICRGGGGDYPRNVMVSPLTGVDPKEYFDVMPYAHAVSDYLVSLLDQVKLPRKLKVCFSSSPENVTHATFRDLGFVACEDGTFSVYIAGGLGVRPKMGVKAAENVPPEEVLYYAKAMLETFMEHGNYEVRSQARTRFMQDKLGVEGLKEAFLGHLEEAKKEDLTICVQPKVISKKGKGTIAANRVHPQKQEGLYTVSYHPIGGCPSLDVFHKLCEAISSMEEVEARLSTDGTMYIINLTAEEAERILELTKGGAETIFESSVSCIGAQVCQQGIRDSQGLLEACVEAVRTAQIPDGALPKISISGCPSSCGAHQTGMIGFQGAAKKVDGQMKAAYAVFPNGCAVQGKERIAESAGIMLEEEIPNFFVELGTVVAESGHSYEQWREENQGLLESMIAKYTN